MKTHMKTHALRTTLALTVVAALALITAACSSVQPVAVQVDDADVTTRLNARLAADPDVSATAVDVDVQDGYVRLSGTVETLEAREEASEIALRTRGVLGVANELRVGDKSLGERIDDATVTAQVKARLAADPDVSATNIDVDTSGGVVTLSGVVKSAIARTEAEELARGVEGVVRVDNRLEIRAD